MKSLLIIFAKPPLMGKVKTRLAKSVGEEEAFRFYQLMLDRTFDLGESNKWETEVVFSEASEFTQEFTRFPHSLQSTGDLGVKMYTAFEKGFKKAYERIVLIGADCPDNSLENIESAFDSLSKNDLVLGPSKDGGYYLIGLKTPIKELFIDIVWSVPTVFQETVKKADKLNLKYSAVQELNDIDYQEDLESSDFFKTKNLNRN